MHHDEEAKRHPLGVFALVFVISACMICTVFLVNYISTYAFRIEALSPTELEIADQVHSGRTAPVTAIERNAIALEKRDRSKKASIAQATSMFISIIICIASLILIMRATSSKPFTVITVSTAIMLILGFASKEVIADYVSTTAAVMEGTVAVGDQVKVSVRFSTPVEGFVEGIHLRGISIRSPDGSSIFITGSLIATVQNFSRLSVDRDCGIVDMVQTRTFKFQTHLHSQDVQALINHAFSSDAYLKTMLSGLPEAIGNPDGSVSITASSFSASVFTELETYFGRLITSAA